jgi:hypothetical protein
MPTAWKMKEARLISAWGDGQTSEAIFLLRNGCTLAYAEQQFHAERRMKDKDCAEEIWKMFWSDKFFNAYYSTMTSLKLVVDEETVLERIWI